MRDSRNITAVCDELAPVADEQIVQARLTTCDYVARLGLPARDAADLMAMLGILPGAEAVDMESGLGPNSADPRSFS